MKVEIWSDVVCPWCYIGKRRFEQALSRFAHRDEVDVKWRSFELDPHASRSAGSEVPHGYRDRLARKYRMSPERAQQMLDSTTATAADEGLDLRFDRAVHANTFEAHQVIHLAAEHGLQAAVKERLLDAHFRDGENVGDRDVLVRRAADAGLDPEEVRAALADQRFAAAVRADEEEAAALGAGGVPFFVIDRRYAVSGAQPAAQFLQVLQRVRDESSPLTVVGTSDAGDTCGPDGCST